MKIKIHKPLIPTPLSHKDYIHQKWSKEIQSLLHINEMQKTMNLPFDDDIYLAMEIIENGIISEELIPKIYENSFSSTLFSARQIAVQEYGYPLLNNKFIEDLTSVLKSEKVLDIGAGSGFLAKQLNQNGVDITAIDKYQSHNNYGFTNPYFNVLEEDGVNHLLNSKSYYDTVILSWPPYDTNMATKILETLLPGQKLIYIGETSGGCTADASFFHLLSKRTLLIQDETEILQRNYSNYASIHDEPYIYLVT